MEDSLSRVLLITGKGGVGKTSVAAATAVRAAVDGARVLVTSTDPAHSLSDVFCCAIGDDPTPISQTGLGVRQGSGRLDAQQIDAQARLERHWGIVRGFLTSALTHGGLDRVRAEELVLLPGLEELFALIDLQQRVEGGEYDVIVVDCAPTAETLRLLALPDALRWYADRLFGTGRRLARLARPLHRSWSEERLPPIPEDEVFDTFEQVHADLAAVHALLQDTSRSSMRLVTVPERLAVAETLRTATSLSLFGYGIDAVVVNRVLPPEVTDPYLQPWLRRQHEHLQALATAFEPLPVLRAPLLEDEPLGLSALQQLGEAVYANLSVSQRLAEASPVEFLIDGDDPLLRLALPFVTSDDLELNRRGDELSIKVAGVRRTLALPSQLRRAQIVSAGLHDGSLQIRFRLPAGTTQS